MIAFVEQGRIAVGVVQEPARERLTYATRGGGCWRRDGAGAKAERCRVSAASELSGERAWCKAGRAIRACPAVRWKH